MQIIHLVIRIAGLAQIVLALSTLFVPKVLKWHTELAKVQPLIKHMFWTYAGYIFVINLSFGALSLFAYRDILSSSNLALIVTAFIAAYWISRLLIQFFYFDRSNFPTGTWHKLAEAFLVILFICLSIVYSWAAYVNFKHL